MDRQGKIAPGVPARQGHTPADRPASHTRPQRETLAHIALIARYGPESFRARGTAEQPGTCLVTISGAVSHPGVVEVEWGTPLQDIARRADALETPSAFLIGGYGGSGSGPQTSPRPTLPWRSVLSGSTPGWA